jgi:hypothetical protein
MTLGVVSQRRSRPSQPVARKEQDSGMTNVRSFTISATAALLLVAGAACADDGDDPPATESPTPSTSSPALTTAPPTKSEAAGTAASDVMRRYFAVVDRIGQDPGVPLQELATVATSIQLSAQRNQLKQQRRQGLTQTGNTKISELTVQSVNLDNSDPEAGKVPTVAIDVCWDVTDVDVVDSSGETTVSPSRPDTGSTRYTVANYQYVENSDDGWRVASGQDLRRATCEAS